MAPKHSINASIALEDFLDSLIKIKEIDMKNSFAVFAPKIETIRDIRSLTKDEFYAILNTADTAPMTTTKRSNKPTTSIYFPWLKDGFKLLLLLGSRRG